MTRRSANAGRQRADDAKSRFEKLNMLRTRRAFEKVNMLRTRPTFENLNMLRTRRAFEKVNKLRTRPTFENLNMLRTRRTIGRAIKKEATSAAAQAGKGDRWADFNLLRTGRSDPVKHLHKFKAFSFCFKRLSLLIYEKIINTPLI
jgi:hypothetical protein